MNLSYAFTPPKDFPNNKTINNTINSNNTSNNTNSNPISSNHLSEIEKEYYSLKKHNNSSGKVFRETSSKVFKENNTNTKQN